MKLYLMIFITLFLCCCKQDHENGATIHVQGSSRLFILPDVAEINIRVLSESPSKDSAFSFVNKTISGLLEDIKATGVKTSSVNTENYDIYFTREQKAKTIIYHGSQGVLVKMNLSTPEIEKLAEIARKYRRVEFEISYSLSHVKQDSVGLILASMALKDADKKAKHISESSGMNLGRILNIAYHAGEFSGSGSGSGGGAGVDYKWDDENGNAYYKKMNLLPVPLELSDDVDVRYSAGAK